MVWYGSLIFCDPVVNVELVLMNELRRITGRPRSFDNQIQCSLQFTLPGSAFGDPKAAPFSSGDRRMEGNDRYRAVSIKFSVPFIYLIARRSDRIADLIRSKVGLTTEQLTLAQILESATWKGGREIAKQKRPATGGPPIDIESDGTVF